MASTTLSIQTGDPKAEGNSGTTPFVFTVTRSGDLSGASAVDYFTWGPLVDQGDFSGALAGTVYFNPGEATRTITIQVVGDQINERDEVFNVALANARGAEITTGSAQTTILNDDFLPTVGFNGVATAAAEGNEGVRTMYITLDRTGDTSGSSYVDWAVTPSGEHPASTSDFAGGAFPSGRASFAPGQTSTVIAVQMTADTVAEPDEEFTVTLSNPTGAIIGRGTTIGRIANDDGSTPPPGDEGQVINSPGPGSTLTGGNGNDTLNASQGSDVLTGGGGADVFAWAREPWSPATVSDFTVGTDKLNLSAVFQSAGYTGSDPIADGRVVLMDQGADTLVLFDDDGPGGEWPNYVIRLQNVESQGLTWAQLSGGGGGGQPPAENEVIRSPGPGSTLNGGDGDDTLISSAGPDVLIGGEGDDHFRFETENWAPATVKDFLGGAGGDVLDLRPLFDAIGYTGTDPWGDGYLSWFQDGGGVKVLFDDDGPGGDWPNYILFLEGAYFGAGPHPGPFALLQSDVLVQ